MRRTREGAVVNMKNAFHMLNCFSLELKVEVFSQIFKFLLVSLTNKIFIVIFSSVFTGSIVQNVDILRLIMTKTY